VGQWAIAIVSGDGGIGWSGSEAEAVDKVGSDISIGSTCIGDSGHGCSTGAGSGGAGTGGVTGATGGMGTVGAVREASSGWGGKKNMGGS
jgi:hypothetical protein